VRRPHSGLAAIRVRPGEGIEEKLPGKRQIWIFLEDELPFGIYFTSHEKEKEPPIENLVTVARYIGSVFDPANCLILGHKSDRVRYDVVWEFS